MIIYNIVIEWNDCHMYWNVICISEIIMGNLFINLKREKFYFVWPSNNDIQAILFKFQLLDVTGSRLPIIWIWIINRSEGSMKAEIIFANQPSRLVLSTVGQFWSQLSLKCCKGHPHCPTVPRSMFLKIPWLFMWTKITPPEAMRTHSKASSMNSAALADF